MHASESDRRANDAGRQRPGVDGRPRICLSARDRDRRRVTVAKSRSAVLSERTSTQLIGAATRGLRTRRLAEVEELLVLAAWADVHSVDGPGGLIHPGGEGTPGVRDYAMGEIALARRAGVVATINAIADVLDLRHRLPLTWQRTQAGVTDVWVVRKIARMTRHLPLGRMWVVDQAVARMLGHQPPPRILEVAEGKVIEADPDLHHERVEAERRQRYVRLGAADEHGLRTLIARLELGDAAWVEATVARVAEILAPRHDDLSSQELRAKAMGYLARPAELLALLAANTTADNATAGNTGADTTTDTDSTESAGSADTDRNSAASDTEASGHPGAARGDISAGNTAADNAGAGAAENSGSTVCAASDTAAKDTGATGHRGAARGDTITANTTAGNATVGSAPAISGRATSGPADAESDAAPSGSPARPHSRDEAPAGSGDPGERHDYDSYHDRDGWADYLARQATDPTLDHEPVGDASGVGDGLNRALAFPADLLGALARINWASLRPRHHLYVHLHEDTLTGDAHAPTRVEGLPAMSLTQLHGLLAGAHVSVRPVVDLNQHVRTSAYEHPETVKERVHLVHGGDYWPYATSVNRRLDYDHVVPFDPKGPPEQTGTHNSAPIGRRHHRYRTHAGYRVRPVRAFNDRPGTHLWTTPHGQAFITDRRGTHPVSRQAAAVIESAPPIAPHDFDGGPPSLDPSDGIHPDPTNPNHYNHLDAGQPAGAH